MENLVTQGVELAIFGMGTVFVFLTLLIFATLLMSKMVLRFGHEPSQATATAVTQHAGDPTQEELVAVISSAISRHRKNN